MLDPVSAGFVPLYLQGEALGHPRSEMRSWPLPYAAVMLGLAEGAEPTIRGSRSLTLPSDRGDTPDRPRPPRPRKRRETGRVFRGKAAT